ncbi:GTP-binding protein EngB required for normal cell division [Methanococcus maripaludis]|uniref:Probable GTP-binding protein EngB n=1 Tax=Methanococcus maripaludis TaxID=39152 RepID=A0A7J9NR00_METMI|nr:GTP-binding protein EngB [Methanococcus maripaludis]MBA2847188.1 GTP-binding protein EngB required for normal cell division [Methanococcus maripaludis]
MYENTNSEENTNNIQSQNMDIQKFKKYIRTEKKADERPKVIVMGRSNVGKSTFVKLVTGKNVRVGKKPGVTLKITEYDMGTYILVDLPGFGFMEGIEKKAQEKIKDEIIHYVEDNKDAIAASIHILDAKSFIDIVERWGNKGEVPIDLEMADFLEELELNPIFVVNKMDKIKNSEWDNHLDKVSETLGFLPPWRQWLDNFVPAIMRDNYGIDGIKHRINKRINSFKKSKK